MAPRPTRELIDSLVEDLAPVRRPPSVTIGLALVLLVWSLGLTVMVIAESPLAAIAGRLAAGSAVRSGLVLGLLASAGAGLVAALAASAPDRQRVAQRLRRVSLGGLALALLCAALDWIRFGAGVAPWSADVACFALGTLLSLGPALVLLALVVRGWVLEPGRAALPALLGAFGLGGLAIHLVCALDGARHALVGHLGVPLLAALVLFAPLALWLRRRRDGSPL